ncbi:hypothetical protein ABR737_00500 [Streptomyces sp. Edi2]|uniref:hypothetical protein n=1 Tax=Streptomyces sp. Edi2 TaxID=3162528 RepID=UPI003306029C
MSAVIQTSHYQESIDKLEQELPELQDREVRLSEELENVKRRKNSVQQALESLRALTGEAPMAKPAEPEADTVPPTDSDPVEATTEDKSVGEAGPEPTPTVQTEQLVEETDTPTAVPQQRAAAKKAVKNNSSKKAPAAKKAGKRTPAKKSGVKATTSKPAAKKAASAKNSASDSPANRGGTLIARAVEVLKKSGESMSVQEINAALGREDSNGQVESLRNTLNRATKDKLVTRPGRGSYAAA